MNTMMDPSKSVFDYTFAGSGLELPGEEFMNAAVSSSAPSTFTDSNPETEINAEETKKEWTCPYPGCNATYVAKQSLNKHWDKKHQGEEIPVQFRVKKRANPGGSMSSPKRKKPSLRQTLRVLDKNQLIEVLCKIAKLPGTVPTTSTVGDLSATTPAELSLLKNPATFYDLVVTLLPKPDLSHVERELDTTMNQLWRAFPNAAYGTNRDHFAFKRVAPHIQHFKSQVSTELKQLASAQNWPTTMEFLIIAARKVNNLPIWDDQTNNKTRNDLWAHILKVYLEACRGVGDVVPYETWEHTHQDLLRYPELEPNIRQVETQIQQLGKRDA